MNRPFSTRQHRRRSLRRALTTGLTLALCVSASYGQDPASPPPVQSADAAAAEPAGPALTVRGDLVVTALRGAELAPVTRSHLDAEQLAALDHGQDLPQLLDATPSVTSYSDSGVGGSGYSYLSLRGLGQQRLNVTLDGVPLNDPEENWVFFADLWDLVGSLASVELQRGVGTSSVGAASYAGALSLESLDPPTAAGYTLTLGGGSYGNRHGAVGFASGPLFGGASSQANGQGLTLRGRISYGESDGYRESSGARQSLAVVGANYVGERSAWRLTALSGRLRSQLAFYAADLDTVIADPRSNPLDPAERDDFTRDMVSLRVVTAVSERTSVAATVYRNGANGWFRLWSDPGTYQQLDEYGLDWVFWGALVNATHLRDELRVDLGIHANDFTSHHQLDRNVDDADPATHERAYRNRGDQQEVSGFVKLGWNASERWLLFGDLQVRHARVAFACDPTLDPSQRVEIPDANWTFVNPKVGVRLAIGDDTSVYVSLGRANREPTRNDRFAGEDNPTLVYDPEVVLPERVDDLELGVELGGDHFRVAANLFAMELRDEIALTGELSAIGLPLRRNVDRSFRRGLEIDTAWRPGLRSELRLAASYTHARIRRFTQAVDVYAADGSYLRSDLVTFADVPPVATPEILVQPNLTVKVAPWLELSLSGRYVGRSHLDNSGSRELTVPGFSELDLGGLWTLPWAPRGATATLRLTIANLLDERDHYPAGYVYSFLTEASSGGPQTSDAVRYVYPLADRHLIARLEVRF